MSVYVSTMDGVCANGGGNRIMVDIVQVPADQSVCRAVTK
jgi:hypothetical protein